jgi:orotidine-5'-phosphate decarboxylase
MTEHNLEADDAKTVTPGTGSDAAEVRASSPARRRALVALATAPVILSIKARSVYAAESPSSAASSKLSKK